MTRYSCRPRRFLRARVWRYLLLSLAIALLLITPGLTQFPDTSSRTLYETGHYPEAILQLQQELQTHRNQGDRQQEAIALRNLSLVYQHLGRWNQAETAIAQSLTLLSNGSEAYAQALEVQGQFQSNRGQRQQAIATWEAALVIYRQRRDEVGSVRSSLHLSEALQEAGLYRRAIALLEPLANSMPDRAPERGRVLRSLGDALRMVGRLAQSEAVLQQSLAIAETSSNPRETALTLLSLADTLTLAESPDDAWTIYRRAASLTRDPSLLSRIQLQRLRSLVKLGGPVTEIQTLLSQMPPLLDQLPPGRRAAQARLHFAQSLLETQTIDVEQPLLSTPATTLAASHLAIARQQAEGLQDARLMSLVFGKLGALYEQTQQWQSAQELTQQALKLAEQQNATEISYLWEWQLGRILRARNQPEKAIAAYSDALELLRAVRNDLINDPNRQGAFQAEVEPLHRELVELLVTQPAPSVEQPRLEQARKTIESLQLTELDNFFREACLQSRPILLNQIDPSAAVFYPIVLGDRLEVIFSLPGERLRHYSAAVSAAQVRVTARELFKRISTAPETNQTSSQDFLLSAQTLYNWLIRPAAEDLVTHSVKTLVFVLEGKLRNLPMAVLHDGDRFLVEQYSVAVAPGLDLLPSQLAPRAELGVLLAGVSQAQAGFSALPNVPTELEKIRAIVGDRSRLLLDADFTQRTLKQAIASTDFSIIHLATHGKLETTARDTFILLGDENRLDVNQLSQILQATEISRRSPIELLVLSACETAATIDAERAALGLAGIAVRSGARSTIATLWQVSDQSTSELMTQFYRGFVQKNLSRAEALRQAQVSLLKTPGYQHPFFWSAAVLVGNWN